MAVDPDDGLITDLMIGLWFVLAADLMALTGFAYLGGYVSRWVFILTTGLTNAAFALWIGRRWLAIRRAQATDRAAVEELKHRYAAGELSDAEFERRLNELLDADEAVATADIDVGDASQPATTDPEPIEE